MTDMEHTFQLVGRIFSSWLSLLSVNFLKIQFLAYIKGSHYLCEKASYLSRLLPGSSFPQVYNPLHTLFLLSVFLPIVFKCHTFPFIPRWSILAMFFYFEELWHNSKIKLYVCGVISAMRKLILEIRNYNF